MKKTTTIVTDIEGTTSSISFVHEVLFPYAARHLPAFVRAHRDDPEVQAALLQTARESGTSIDDTEALIGVLLAWIRDDRKVTPLKALQGLIWRDGYRSGAYRGHVYAEVAACLQAWRAQGIALYVYSSGSIEAQKQLFGHSESGDLTSLFAGYFDTTTGPKRETASYAAIARSIGAPAESILFLSDIEAELDAARSAGMQTCWLRRDLSDLSVSASHPVALNFEQVAARL